MTKGGDNGFSSKVRFGDFEADLRTGELYRRRKRIKLAEQSVRILALLLENPGELVTREEMRARLWPEQTYVDFDRSLNNVILDLRRALRDSPRRARFIETLPKRGYRFIADVERVEPDTGNSDAPDQAEVVSRARRALSLVGLIGLPAALIWGATVAFGPADQADPLHAQELVGALPSGLAHVWGAISPDGQQLARRDGDDGRLFIEDLSTGESRLLVDDPVLRTMVWSPDGSEIAVVRAREGDHLLEVIDVASGESRLLLISSPAPTVIPEYRVPVAWDGVGNRLLLVSSFGDQVEALSLETLDLEPLDIGARVTRAADLSPDGRFLASPSGPGVDILRTDGGGEPARIRAFDERATLPVWSPDGTSVFFMRQFRNNSKVELWSASIDRDTGSLIGEPSLLAPLATVRGSIQPVVTENGEYVWAHQDSWNSARVMEVEPRTGQPVDDVVTDLPRGTHAEIWSPTEPTLFAFDRTLNWQLSGLELLRRYDMETGREGIVQLPRVGDRRWYSKDLTKALTVDRSDRQSTVYLFDLVNEERTELFSYDSRISSARLSDDSGSVAFRGGAILGEQGSVGVVDLATGSVRMLYEGAKVENPNWSPNGSELAIADRPCVKIVRVESEEVETLACYAEPPEQDAGVRTMSPHWSPDGSMLVWGALNPALRRHEIWILDRSTGTHNVIWTGEEDYKTEATLPMWSSDGRFIAYTLVDNPPVEIWKLRHPMLTSGTPSVSD